MVSSGKEDQRLQMYKQHDSRCTGVFDGSESDLEAFICLSNGNILPWLHGVYG